MAQTNTSAPVRTGFITGGASGIGLALAQHLLESDAIKWRIVLADINEEAGRKTLSELSHKYNGDRATFVKLDVTSFDDTASAFKYAFEWCNGRIDFFAANAGAAPEWKDALLGSEDSIDDDEAPLEPPDLKTIDLLLISQYYGFKCFLHYIRKTRRQEKKSGDSTDPYHPHMVSTASTTGLYKYPRNPVYGPAKAAVIHFVRCMADRIYEDDGLCMNAICPGYVETNIWSENVKRACPAEMKTPLSVIVECYDELLVGIAGNKTPKVGGIAETSASNIHWPVPPDFSDENMRNLISMGLNPEWFSK